ncbi:MAG: aminotransferase class I/II-fold pyridoxal phosphate-dependent enzyme [Acidobacteria bacterium]|nr:aminotransferase class I/II-fold pyridoxal phosphate-dependent enzyme [Acidobacteriota bacterium]
MLAMWSRRLFVGAAAALAAGPVHAAKTGSDKPAVLGGKPVRTESFPSWPLVEKNDEKLLLETLRSRLWNRRNGRNTESFEKAWATKIGAGHAVATNGGTTALYAGLAALDIGPKDEVIVPPYTFIATVNAVLQHHALPVFVDTDFQTHQIDPSKIEAAITKNTRVILPVHIAGSAADMDAILAIGKKHGIPVLEDACQAHLGEWRGRKLGTLGAAGCFSFQASKNLNCGEGGCLVTNDRDLAVRASAFQNNGNPLHGDGKNRGYGSNLRMTEFQASVLHAQMERLDEQAARRSANAAYLDGLLADVAGVTPARRYEGCTRSAYHLYMLRYEPEAFGGMSKARFMEAVKAEGIPLSGGYHPLNHDDFLEKAFQTRAFRAVYSSGEMAKWRERNVTPVNDRLCGEAFWFGQTTLLGERSDMEQIAEAFHKIHRFAGEIGRG